MTQLLKRGLRKAARVARNWLAEPTPAPSPGQSRFAYAEINAIVEHIAATLGPVQRPAYAWGVVQAAHLAKHLGVERVSALELGVAGGNGLVALDRIAPLVEDALGVGVEVYGFDSGRGLPKPKDWRDLPNLWSAGDFPMDEAALRGRLQRAKLILGLVADTIPTFLQENPAPIGFISFDLDLYTSTKQAFALLEAEPARLLPRIHCYMDDILGFTFADFNGERLAMAEFNVEHETRKFSPIYGLRFYVPPRHFNAMWVEKFYMLHILDHPLYSAYDGLVRRPRMDLE